VVTIAAQQNSGTKSFYVQVTDANGNKASKRIEYETIESAKICEIFPNPVRDNATLKLILEENGTAIIEIFNSSGQNISQKQSSVSAGTYYLDISDICADLSPGLYHLRIRVGGIEGVVRFVKG
jgi:Flp pilus assembly secretin CpaC